MAEDSAAQVEREGFYIRGASKMDKRGMAKENYLTAAELVMLAR
jgi:hypothetical protein